MGADCKSVAKASKVRILHPPRVTRARSGIRRSGPFAHLDWSMEPIAPESAGRSAEVPTTRGSRSDVRRVWVIVGVLLVVAFLGFVLWRGGTTVFYVVMGWFAALAMEPAVSRLTRWMPRAAATGLVMVAVLLAVVGFLWAFGSLLADPLAALVEAAPDIATDVLAWVNRVTGSDFTLDRLLETAGLSGGGLTAYAQDVAIGLIGVLAAVLSAAFGLFVIRLLRLLHLGGHARPAGTGWGSGCRPRPGAVPHRVGAGPGQGRRVHRRPGRPRLHQRGGQRNRVRAARPALWLPLALWTGIVAQFIPNVGTYISIALPALVGFTSGEPLLGVWVLAWGIAYQQVET